MIFLFGFMLTVGLMMVFDKDLELGDGARLFGFLCCVVAFAIFCVFSVKSKNSVIMPANEVVKDK